MGVKKRHVSKKWLVMVMDKDSSRTEMRSMDSNLCCCYLFFVNYYLFSQIHQTKTSRITHTTHTRVLLHTFFYRFSEQANICYVPEIPAERDVSAEKMRKKGTSLNRNHSDIKCERGFFQKFCDGIKSSNDSPNVSYLNPIYL